MPLLVSSGILCMVCVGKETSACSHMTWQTASHLPSASTTRRAAVLTGPAAGKSPALPWLRCVGHRQGLRSFAWGMGLDEGKLTFKSKRGAGNEGYL